MNWKWISIGFLALFNFYSMIVASKGFLKFLIFIDVMVILMIFLINLIIDRTISRPKSLSESYKIAKKEYIKMTYDTTDIDIPMEFKEIGRYKESVHDTKKGVVNMFIIKNLLKSDKIDNTIIAKDDPYDKTKSSLVWIGKTKFMDRIISSKADIDVRKSVPTVKIAGSTKTKKKGEKGDEMIQSVQVQTETPIENK